MALGPSSDGPSSGGLSYGRPSNGGPSTVGPSNGGPSNSFLDLLTGFYITKIHIFGPPKSLRL